MSATALGENGERESPESLALPGPRGAASPPYSIVTAARDRSSQLQRSATAISLHGTHSEHLILDWSSQPAIQPRELPADPRIRLVRQEGEGDWWLSRAYNRAFQLASHDWILKADADALLEEPFFASFRPAVATLQIRHLVGGVAAAGRLDDLGLFAVERPALLAVGGFNSYLFGWGFDDLDLFERLFLQPGSTLAHLPAAGVRSLPHGTAQRLGAPEGQPQPRWPWSRALQRQRLQGQLEANRRLAALTRGWPLALDAPADCLERLPAELLLERRRALLQGWLRPLLGRHGRGLATALPAAWLGALLGALALSDLPRRPDGAPRRGCARASGDAPA